MQHMRSSFAVILSFAAIVCMSPASAWSRVIVDDMVVVKGQKVMLMAETKGKVFSKGGELVEFFVDGKSIGKNLSGGDGVAYKAFTPERTGLHKIRVTSDEGEDTGLLLSLRKGSGIVFVDVEGCLLETLFSRKAREGSQEAVKEINQRSPVVFLQRGLFGVDFTQEWLRENEFVELPVVSWRKGAIFDEVAEEGLEVKAVIGAPKVIESAMEHAPLSFSFEQVEGAEWVGSWGEIGKKLK
ncbi:MAG: hypothetical protein JRI70_03995 [Deltaproteobacteria bacterium]|nr:hypothetical protein [Deltaproteobacteria bacterium]